MPGTKHLIQCHCMLPQYRKMAEPVFHKFVVYSKVSEKDEICKSEIVTKIEDTDVIIDEEEIKLGLPDKVVKILEKNNSDLATYEAIDHIFEEEIWDTEVVVARQTQGEKINLEILHIKSESRFRLKSESIDFINEG